MYNKKQPHYIFGMSSGNLLDIYYMQNKGICFRKLVPDKHRAAPVILLKEAFPDFSACMDLSKNMHLLCQDRNGSLIHYYTKNKLWQKTIVSETGDASIFPRHPRIHMLNDRLYLFHIAVNSGRKQLCYQVYNEDGLASPEIMDNISTGQLHYTIQEHGDGSIFIYYVKHEKHGDSLGYRRINAETGRADEFNIICNSAELSDYKITDILCDAEENYHLTVQRQLGIACELAYIRFSGQGESLFRQITAASADNTLASATMLVHGNSLVIFWIENNSIYLSSSADSGVKWSAPEFYHADEDGIVCCARLNSNNNPGQDTKGYAFIPADISEGINPLIINDYFIETEVDEEMDEYKALILNTLKSITEALNEISKENKEIIEKINKLDAHQIKAEKELPAEAVKDMRELNQPVMIGNGFSGITYDYLNNIKKK